MASNSNRSSDPPELSEERRVRLLLDAVVDYAIYMLDLDGYVTSWNPGAERIKGYKPDEVLGQHFRNFFTPEDREDGRPERALEAARHYGRFEHEGWRVRKDGTLFWAHAVIDAIHNEDGEVIGFAKITRDNTEQHHAEQQLEVARQELQQAQKLEALGHLTGGIAHDFNNILTAIINNLELLNAADVTVQARERYVDRALQAARNGAALVNQMLVFARRQRSEVLSIDVNRAVEEIVLLVQRSGPENIRIETDLAAGLPPAKADPNQLQTSILNLTVNAQDAMPAGGTLRIQTSRCVVHEGDRTKLTPGEYVCVCVTDTGVGMTPDVLEHIFEPFFTTKEVGKGTGLGLSMVYGMLGHIGGNIEVESQPGEGTKVTMYLPVGEAVEESEPMPEHVSWESGGDAMQQGTAKLLYVEDDFLVGLSTLDIFEGAGLQAHLAANGEEGLQLLKQHPEIELLVTDIGLPGMNGHQFVAEARKTKPDLKVVFVTGYDRTGTAAKTPMDEATRYVDKPFDPQKLLTTVKSLLSAESGATR
jgi:PAS domain S-box-containing protein